MFKELNKAQLLPLLHKVWLNIAVLKKQLSAKSCTCHDWQQNKTSRDSGADGYYAVAGQGKYSAANGKDVDVEFIPEDNFVGTADGISIRRTDNNGNDTDWNSKDATELPSINEVLDNMDGLYILL